MKFLTNEEHTWNLIKECLNVVKGDLSPAYSTVKCFCLTRIL